MEYVRSRLKGDIFTQQKIIYPHRIVFILHNEIAAHDGQSVLTKISEGNAKEYNGKAFVGLIEKNYKQGVSTEQSICQCLQ